MKTRSIAGTVAAVWGLGGFLALLLFAIYRLTPIAWQALEATLYWYHWLGFFINVAFMAYSEGYRGFQRRYSPRLIARVRHLLHKPTSLQLVLAPAFCMGYFGAGRRNAVSAWLLLAMIGVLIAVFQQLPQPWRGLLDAGVVVGLSWGLLATIVLVIKPCDDNGEAVA